MDRILRSCFISLSCVLPFLAAPRAADAMCSIIPPDGTAQRAYLGSLRSPFLFPGLTNDVMVNPLECDHADDSVAPDFVVNGDEVADDFVITIAFVPKDAAPTLLVLSDDPTLCGEDPACSVDTTMEREIVEIPRETGVQRALRFRFPDVAPAVGPARLGVRLKGGSVPPVASELRTTKCRDTADDTYVACVDEFYASDGSCRVGDAFLAKPFSDLVVVPRTEFSDICTDGCGGVPPLLPGLPVTTDRHGNAIFGMIYTPWLIKVDRGDGQIEPRPRRFDLAVQQAALNGFVDAIYEGTPSSHTAEGFRVSPPFEASDDPTRPASEVAFWAMNDGDGGVHLVPRQHCSDDPHRACQADADCASGAVCSAVEFDFPQDGQVVQLPLARASVGEAVELNSWLDGDLRDDAVAITIDEQLGGEAINHDGAADDFVVQLLDRGTGLYKRLRGLFFGRGLAQVRVAEADRDFQEPSVAAEDDRLAFLESEYAEGLASPLAGTTAAEANAADDNQNLRLDYNLRAFALPTDPNEPDATPLLTGADVAALPELRFDGRNVVLSQGNLFFAYSPSKQGHHAFQRADQASDGSLGNFFAGSADVSPDGRFLAFVSGADNLFVPAPPGPTSTTTDGGTHVDVLTTSGEIPDVVNGQSVFEFEALDNGKGPKPSRFNVEIKLCDTSEAQPDLVALFDPVASGPNVQIKPTATSCDGCNFPGSWLAEFDRGLGAGSSQVYRLVFNSPDIPPAEVGISFKAGGQAEVSTIRGPGCVDPTIQGGIPRVYLRDVITGETQLVSGLDRTSCSDPATAVDIASGSPDVVVAAGESVFFDSDAALSGDDTDGATDVYRYDASTCSVTNLSASFTGPAADPSSSGDGLLVAFEVGAPSDVVLLDVAGGTSTNFGPGVDPALSADGTKLVFASDVGVVSQVFLVDLLDPIPVAVPMSVEDGSGGAFLASGGGNPDVADDGRAAFESPVGDPDAEILTRDLESGRNRFATSAALGVPLCTSSPCGAFSPSISRDGRFVSYTVSGLGPVDEIVIADLLTGSLTPLTRMGGADADSFAAQLGSHADHVVFSSFASAIGTAPGGGTPGIFLEGPVDASASGEAMLGVLDLASCDGASACVPQLTNELVEKGAVYAGDVAVVGSPVRVVDVNGGNFSVTSFGREGSAVALSANYVCAVTDTDDNGAAGSFAACGARSAGSLSDLTITGVSVAASDVGLCGSRAVALGTDGVLYVADLSAGTAATALQPAEDFALGDDLDLDGDGTADTCLVAFRTLELDLAGAADAVGNRDVDKDDEAMYVLGTDGVTTDCGSSTIDCPGQACRKFNYQVGRESVLFVVDESKENYGIADACLIGTDSNEDGQCGNIVRRCSAAGALTEGTAFGFAANLFSANRFQDDGENTVILAGFCGTDPANVRIPQFCTSDLDCLDQPGETCQIDVVLSAAADQDGDEVPDFRDNCPDRFNPGQEDEDGDGFGDACDTFTCGNGVVQEAETCDEGASNGMPGSSCSLECTCQVNFTVLETLKPGSNGNTPYVVFGSSTPDGGGCLNLDNKAVGDEPAKGIDAPTLRLSATQPAMECPAAGGAPAHDLGKNGRYNAHLEDLNLDGILDLRVHGDTQGIGGDSSTTMLWLTGRLRDGACFESVAPVDVAGEK